MKVLAAVNQELRPATFPTSPTHDESHLKQVNSNKAVWIGLNFPRLIMDSFYPPEGIPVVIIEEQKNGPVIYAACDIAMHEGITPGMSLNAAYAFCRNLLVYLRNINQEEQALKKLAWQAAVFTPGITLVPPDTLLLEVSGSLRLFGGLEALRKRVMNVFGSKALISVAPTPAAARLLAKNGWENTILHPPAIKSGLGDLPLQQSDIDSGLTQRLSKCGLRRLRDLWRLPSEDLARRFGSALTAYLERICGDRPDPQPVYTPALQFNDQLPLPTQSIDIEMIIAAAEKLLQRARTFLQSHRAVTESVRFELCHIEQRNRSRSDTEIIIRLQQPDREPCRFLPQLIERLNRLQLPAPVDNVLLHIDHVIHWHGQHFDLFHNRESDQQGWAQLLSVLTARLGESMVYVVRDVDDHRPEKAWRTDRVNQAALSKPHRPQSNTTLSWSPVRRPIWLLPTPKSLDASSNIPALISEADGEAERIEAGWWDRDDCRRDYYSISTDQGLRWWLFRDLNATPPKWYLHGLFA